MPHKSLPDIALDPFGEHVRYPYTGCWPVLGAHCHVDSNDARLLRLAESAFAGLPHHQLSRRSPDLHLRLIALQARPVPRKPRPEFAMVSGAGLLAAAGSDTGFMALSVERRAALITVGPAQLRHPHDVRYDMIECALYTLAARTQRLIPLHAACISDGRRGLLIMGASGAGKSTLAWHALNAGLDFVAEDSVFVTPRTLHATGIANFLHLRTDSPHADAACRGAPVIRRRSGVRKFEIDARRHGFKLAPHAVALVGSVFLSARAPGARGLSMPLSKPLAAQRLREGQPYAAAQAGWAEFSRTLLTRPCIELRRAPDPAAAVAAITAMLEKR